jgi:hypothetical protein
LEDLNVEGVLTSQISKSGTRTPPREYNAWWSQKRYVSTDYITCRIIVVRPFQVYFHSYFTFDTFNIYNKFNCIRHC